MGYVPNPYSALRRRAALISLVVGVFMLCGKWTAYLVTGSHAILSDALESIVHIAATGFALLSIILSERPPDPKYPYGYGKITYFSAGFEGGLIALAALAIFYEAGQGLFQKLPLTRLDIGFSIILVASIVNLLLGLWLIQQGNESKSLVLVADGKHVLSDAYTSFGVVVGVALVWATNIRWLDSVVAILLGVNILWTGYQLVREAVLGLMDRADNGLLTTIISALQEVRPEGWLDIHQLRAWSAGDKTFVDFHLVVPLDWTVTRLHESHDLARTTIRNVLGPSTDIIIHFDPEQEGFETLGPRPAFGLVEATRVPSRTTRDDREVSRSAAQ